MRFFNTPGPVAVADHDGIPPLERLALGGMLIREKRDFILHALRQTGTAADSGIEIDIWDM